MQVCKVRWEPGGKGECIGEGGTGHGEEGLGGKTT